MPRPPTDKRERLIQAAIQRFHAAGFARTSLADVATEAGIPKGNVFYYFPTKEALARAVVDEWCRLMEHYLSLLAPLPTPRRRIEGFIDQAVRMSETYVKIGCPLAGLARDLKQEGEELAKEAGRVYSVQWNWLKNQFVDATFTPSHATEHTRFLFTGYHGAILLAHAHSDPQWIASEVKGLKRWLDGVFKTLRE